jgi:hypothetical protein
MVFSTKDGKRTTIENPFQIHQRNPKSITRDHQNNPKDQSGEIDDNEMIQLPHRSSTSPASPSTSTKNSQNKTMHRSGRSAALNFRNFFGGHSVMVAVTLIRELHGANFNS